jgi:hypothetical protein
MGEPKKLISESGLTTEESQVEARSNNTLQKRYNSLENSTGITNGRRK